MAHQLPLPEGQDCITAEWMTQALKAGGEIDPMAVTALAFEGVGSGVGLMGSILRCHLTYANASDGRPDSVIVKMASSRHKNLSLAKKLGLYKREYDFYRLLSDHAPIRSPKLFFADFDDETHRFVLILEDFHAMAMVDQSVGADESQAMVAIRAAARLHGFYWNKERFLTESGFGHVFNRKRRLIFQAMYSAYLETTLRNFNYCFTPRTRHLAESLGAGMAQHLKTRANMPRTLTHGDFRLDNMFFGTAGTDEFAAIDWQVSGLYSGLRDVSYFLAGSVLPETRRKIEKDVLQEYYGLLRSSSVEDFTYEECWRQYRAHTLDGLILLVFACGGLELAEENDRLLVEMGLKRILAATEDLAAEEFLPDRSRIWSLGSILSRITYQAIKFLR